MRFGRIFSQGDCQLGPELRQAESPSWTVTLSSTVQRLLTATNASFRVSQFHEFGGPSNAVQGLQLGGL